jgi:hypothetical protein
VIEVPAGGRGVVRCDSEAGRGPRGGGRNGRRG